MPAMQHGDTEGPVRRKEKPDPGGQFRCRCFRQYRQARLEQLQAQSRQDPPGCCKPQANPAPQVQRFSGIVPKAHGKQCIIKPVDQIFRSGADQPPCRRHSQKRPVGRNQCRGSCHGQAVYGAQRQQKEASTYLFCGMGGGGIDLFQAEADKTVHNKKPEPELHRRSSFPLWR